MLGFVRWNLSDLQGPLTIPCPAWISPSYVLTSHVPMQGTSSLVGDLPTVSSRVHWLFLLCSAARLVVCCTQCRCSPVLFHDYFSSGLLVKGWQVSTWKHLLLPFFKANSRWHCCCPFDLEQKFPWLRCWFTLRLPGKGLPEGLPPPTVAPLTDVFSVTLIFSLFLPVTLLLQGVLNFDSSFFDCWGKAWLTLTTLPRFPPIYHLLGQLLLPKRRQ